MSSCVYFKPLIWFIIQTRFVSISLKIFKIFCKFKRTFFFFFVVYINVGFLNKNLVTMKLFVDKEKVRCPLEFPWALHWRQFENFQIFVKSHWSVWGNSRWHVTNFKSINKNIIILHHFIFSWVVLFFYLLLDFYYHYHSFFFSYQNIWTDLVHVFFWEKNNDLVSNGKNILQINNCQYENNST